MIVLERDERERERERERGGWFFQIRGGGNVEWAESIGSVNDQRGREGGMDGESKRTVEEERPFLLLPNVMRSSSPPSPLWEYGRALESRSRICAK